MSYNTRSANNAVVNKWLKTPQGEFTLSFVKHVEYELKKNKFTIAFLCLVFICKSVFTEFIGWQGNG